MEAVGEDVVILPVEPFVNSYGSSKVLTLRNEPDSTVTLTYLVKCRLPGESHI
jgi:hypothetical protein